MSNAIAALCGVTQWYLQMDSLLLFFYQMQMSACADFEGPQIS
ncbi:MAG: hypothetical protein ACR2PF_08475 [Rhizobiaceae bacterium]